MTTRDQPPQQYVKPPPAAPPEAVRYWLTDKGHTALGTADARPTRTGSGRGVGRSMAKHLNTAHPGAVLARAAREGA